MDASERGRGLPVAFVFDPSSSLIIITRRWASDDADGTAMDVWDLGGSESEEEECDEAAAAAAATFAGTLHCCYHQPHAGAFAAHSQFAHGAQVKL